MYSKLVWTPCTKYFKKECRNIKKYDYDMKEKWEPIFEGILAHLCAQCSKPKFPSCISKSSKSISTLNSSAALLAVLGSPFPMLLHQFFNRNQEFK